MGPAAPSSGPTVLDAVAEHLGSLDSVAVLATEGSLAFINGDAETLDIARGDDAPTSASLTEVHLDYASGVLIWGAGRGDDRRILVLDLRGPATAEPVPLLRGRATVTVTFREPSEPRPASRPGPHIIDVTRDGIELLDPYPGVALDDRGARILLDAVQRPQWQPKPPNLGEAVLPVRVPGTGPYRHCGDAIEWPSANLWAVRVAIVGDLCHVVWQLYDPKDRTFLDLPRGIRSKRRLESTALDDLYGCADRKSYVERGAFVSYEHGLIRSGSAAACLRPSFYFDVSSLESEKGLLGTARESPMDRPGCARPSLPRLRSLAEVGGAEQGPARRGRVLRLGVSEGEPRAEIDRGPSMERDRLPGRSDGLRKAQPLRPCGRSRLGLERDRTVVGGRALA